SSAGRLRGACATGRAVPPARGCPPAAPSSRPPRSACPPRCSSIRSTIPPTLGSRVERLVGISRSGAGTLPPDVAKKTSTGFFLRGRSGCKVASSWLSDSVIRGLWAAGSLYVLVSEEHVPRPHRKADALVLRLRFSRLAAHFSQVLECGESL